MTAGSAVIRVGPAGWSYPDWKGIVYPPEMPRQLHPLEYLSRYFDTIEVNASFYRPFPPGNAERWVNLLRGNPGFKFTAKLYRAFTHERESWPQQPDIDAVRAGFDVLMGAQRLGAVLVQFPWSFKRTVENRQWLARVLGTFSEYPLALEVRHASWNRPEVFDELARREIAFCNVDQPLFSGSLGPTARVTARVGYVRLHGRNAGDWFREDAGRNERYDYLYSLEELNPWLQKIERLRERAAELYVITNNHYRGQAVVNAFELQTALGIQKGARLPESLRDAYPRLSGASSG
ncbi:MAG TPA: DUF72 domain-containing protein [Candidatus Hydrogenedentes bacterium]|nr:DUF72 domain-containing protein [Candidatus Hydrogenedentota bacterium]